MVEQKLIWRLDGQDLTVGMTSAGEGPPLLLLPALSSISTRREMAGLQERLGGCFATVSVDWPGFGDLPRPAVDWQPEMLVRFLAFLRDSLPAPPKATITAGHAASYVIDAAARERDALGRLILIAPTWRGPLPTMAGGHKPLFDRLRRAIASPLVGPALYRLNVNPFTVERMGRGHVYADPAWLSGARLQEKLALTSADGARYASAAFVTGGLDLYRTREDFLAAAAAAAPFLQIFGEDSPRKSRVEMEALASLPGVTTIRLPRGKLALHEEFPAEVAAPIFDYLAGI